MMQQLDKLKWQKPGSKVDAEIDARWAKLKRGGAWVFEMKDGRYDVFTFDPPATSAAAVIAATPDEMWKSLDAIVAQAVLYELLKE
jgi:beta-lactamase class A